MASSLNSQGQQLPDTNSSISPSSTATCPTVDIASEAGMRSNSDPTSNTHENHREEDSPSTSSIHKQHNKWVGDLSLEDGDRRGDERGTAEEMVVRKVESLHIVDVGERCDASDNSLETDVGNNTISDTRVSRKSNHDVDIANIGICEESGSNVSNTSAESKQNNEAEVGSERLSRLTSAQESNPAPLTSIEEGKTLNSALAKNVSLCDELRQLSRVNSNVEQGSVSNIRVGRGPEEGKRSHSTETSVSERRGTHIARLIQGKNGNLVGDKPIYPNVPFSPYGSPSSSPGLRRRPLKESRRVSIERNGEYTQLNQYKLKQAIGQVRIIIILFCKRISYCWDTSYNIVYLRSIQI